MKMTKNTSHQLGKHHSHRDKHKHRKQFSLIIFSCIFKHLVQNQWPLHLPYSVFIESLLLDASGKLLSGHLYPPQKQVSIETCLSRARRVSWWTSGPLNPSMPCRDTRMSHLLIKLQRCPLTGITGKVDGVITQKYRLVFLYLCASVFHVCVVVNPF